jgi:hypothetical protein
MILKKTLTNQFRYWPNVLPVFSSLLLVLFCFVFGMATGAQIVVGVEYDEDGNEQVIETTDVHPFWVVTDEPDMSRAAREFADGMYHGNIAGNEHGYWVEAKNLRVGDVFLGANGELSTLTGILRVEQADGIAVFNFTVEGNHNYFILAKECENGPTCVLVHNSNPCAVAPMPGDIMTYGQWENLPTNLKVGLQGHHPVAQSVLKKHGIDPRKAPVIVMEINDHEVTKNFKNRGGHSKDTLREAIDRGFTDPALQQYGGQLFELYSQTMAFLRRSAWSL